MTLQSPSFLKYPASTLLLTLLLVCSTPIYAQEPYTTLSIHIVIYRDGVAHVTHNLAVSGEYPFITMTLLSQPVENILVVDGRDTPLSCQVTGSEIRVDTLGSTTVKLEYDTQALTSKEEAIWTLKFTTSEEATVVMPQGASIIYLSGLPAAIRTSDGRSVFILQQGRWEISYTLAMPEPASPKATPTPTPTSPPVKPPEGPVKTAPLLPFDPFILVLIFGIIIVSFITVFMAKRRSKLDTASFELRSEDRSVIQFIIEKGGRALESEIRQKFLLPKTSVWRQVKRLERMGLVRITRIGYQNQIELVEGWREKI